MCRVELNAQLLGFLSCVKLCYLVPPSSCIRVEWVLSCSVMLIMSVHLFTSFSGVQHEELHVVLPEGAERAQREAGQRGGGGAPRQGLNSKEEKKIGLKISLRSVF